MATDILVTIFVALPIVVLTCLALYFLAREEDEERRIRNNRR
jgi:hypothetical protein